MGLSFVGSRRTFAILLALTACGRPSENIPPPDLPKIRDSAAAVTSTDSARRFSLDLSRVSDSVIAFDTITLETLLLSDAPVDISVDKLVSGNLDDDPFTELLLVTHEWYPPSGNDSIDRDRAFTDHFIVVDSSAAGARIIHDSEISNTVAADGAPTVGIFNRKVVSPAFYVKQYSTRGSGAIFSYMRVFRLWKGAVHESDMIVAASRLSICGDINQSALSDITQPSGERLRVKLVYEFIIYNRCVPEEALDKSCEDLPLVSGDPVIYYNWDTASARYIPDYRGTGLTPAKMKCIMLLGPDDIFRAGFGEDLEKLARSAPSRCRRALARYALDNLP